MHIDGNLKGSSVGYKSWKLTFQKVKKRIISSRFIKFSAGERWMKMMRMVCNNEIYKKDWIVHKSVDFNHFVTSCGGNKIMGDSKERTNQKELCENVRYVSN